MGGRACYNYFLYAYSWVWHCFTNKEASHIDIYYEKRHCDVWGWGGGGGLESWRFSTQTSIIDKSYTKKQQTSKYRASPLIFWTYILIFFKNTLSLYLNCRSITTKRSLKPVLFIWVVDLFHCTDLFHCVWWTIHQIYGISLKVMWPEIKPLLPASYSIRCNRGTRVNVYPIGAFIWGQLNIDK